MVFDKKSSCDFLDQFILIKFLLIILISEANMVYDLLDQFILIKFLLVILISKANMVYDPFGNMS